MGFVMHTKSQASETFVLSLTRGMGIPYAHLKCLGKTHAGPHLIQTTTLQFKPQLRLSFSNIHFLHIHENHENKNRCENKLWCGTPQ
jgi:hypothetical protein